MISTDNPSAAALSDRESNTRGWAAPLLLSLAQLSLALPYLTTVPRVYNDEAWEASLGKELATNGSLRHGIIEGWGGMHVHFVQNQVVMPFFLAPIYRLVGCTIGTSRSASVLISVIAVLCIYGAMRLLYGRRAAFWIALCAIAHPWFFEISRRVRPEIYYVAFGFAGLWCLLCAMGINAGNRKTTGMYEANGATRKRPMAWALLAGVLAGLAALTHPTGLVLVIALGGGVLIAFGWRASRRPIAAALIGGGAAILPYVVYVLWAARDPQVNFLQQMTGHRETPVGVGWTQFMFDELYRWRHFFQWPRGAPLAGLFVSAWSVAWLRPDRSDKLFATAIVLFALAMPLTTVNNTSRYLIALTPMFAALLVRMLVRMRGLGRVRVRYAVVLLAIGYGLCCAGGIGMMFARLRHADATRVFDRVAAVTGPDARVFGRMLLWFGGDRYQYGPFPINHRWRVQANAVRRHRFDYAVRSAWDFNSSGGLAVPPEAMPPFRPNDDIDPICKRFGERIAAFRDPDFGPFEIYRLHWDRATNTSD